MIWDIVAAVLSCFHPSALSFLDVVGFESELLFRHLLHGMVAAASFTGEFTYGDPPTSLVSHIDDLSIAGIIDGAFFSLPTLSPT